ncbi:MAG: RNA-binding protein [Mariprofundaceae bacterium]|nr:RNA-binding protein [Mariprofundaceae bacterium]
MSFSCFVKLAIGAALLAVAGFFAAKLLGLSVDLMPVASIFATGLFLGAIIGGVATALYGSAAHGSDSDTVTLYVGNLPFTATKEEVEDLFRPYGTVHDVRLVTGGPNRRPKGYGFVEMDAYGAKDAAKLNGIDMGGRKLRINEARDRNE